MMWLESATLALALASTAAALLASGWGFQGSRRSRRAVLRLVAGYVR